MDVMIVFIILLMNFVTLFTILSAFFYWKSKDLKVVNHVLPVCVSATIDIIFMGLKVVNAPICLSSLVILFLGINYSSPDWPFNKKRVNFHKLLIMILAICLIPCVSLLADIQEHSGNSLTGFVVGLIFLIASLFVLSFTNPIKATGKRGVARLKGAGFIFLGIVLSILFEYLLQLSTREILIISFGIISLLITIPLSLELFIKR